MNAPRINIIYDFEPDEEDIDDGEQYVCPILDGNNESRYGYGYNYEEDSIDPIFWGN